jgi:hypothetical protein
MASFQANLLFDRSAMAGHHHRMGAFPKAQDFLVLIEQELIERQIRRRVVRRDIQ